MDFANVTNEFFRNHLQVALLPTAEDNWLHEDVADLKLVYQLNLAGQIVPVTEKITKKLTCSELSDTKELRKLAFTNMKKQNFRLESVGQLLRESGVPIEDSAYTNLYVITSSAFDTPALVLDPQIDQMVREVNGFENGYYILPCSIHESLAVSKDVASAADLTEMVRSINRNNIAPKDFLSDYIYVYENGNLVIAA